VGFFPIKYLGVPVSASRIQVSNWQKLEDKLCKKLDTWQGNLLEYESCNRGVTITELESNSVMN
jgi:hypothetical protein